MSLSPLPARNLCRVSPACRCFPGNLPIDDTRRAFGPKFTSRDRAVMLLVINYNFLCQGEEVSTSHCHDLLGGWGGTRDLPTAKQWKKNCVGSGRMNGK